MAEPGSGTCDLWATIADIRGPCSGVAFDSDDIDDALQSASDILFHLSGKRFPGTCTATIRPTCQPSSDYVKNRVVQVGSYGYEGGFTYTVPGKPGLYVTQIRLAPSPVVSITQVLMDGVVVDPATYRVDEWKYLVRLTNTTTNINPGWIASQDMHLPPTEENTLQVTYIYGRTPPASGRRAAGSLACELLLARHPDIKESSKCRLPQRVQSITRQGVSMIVLDPLDLLDKGKTGIPEVDFFLAAYNPSRLKRASQVYSPNVLPRARRTDT